MGIEVIALGVVIIILGLVIFRALRGDNREAPVAHQPKDDSKIEKPTPSERDNDNRGSTLTGGLSGNVQEQPGLSLDEYYKNQDELNPATEDTQPTKAVSPAHPNESALPSTQPTPPMPDLKQTQEWMDKLAEEKADLEDEMTQFDNVGEDEIEEEIDDGILLSGDGEIEETIEEEPILDTDYPRKKKEQEKPATTAHFSAFYPKEAEVNQRYSAVIYAHAETMLEQIQQDAERFKTEFGGDVPSPRIAKQSKSLQHGSKITVLLESEELEFEPDILTKTWHGDWTRFNFEFRPSDEFVDETAFVRASIMVLGFEIAKIKFAIEIIAPQAQVSARGDEPMVMSFDVPDNPPENPFARAKLQSTTTNGYDKIFISYSRKDKLIAEAFKVIQEAAGNDVFFDVDDIRTGADWQAAIARAIDTADYMQVFWSENSAGSEWCGYEWDYALTYRCQDTKCREFIRPVWWTAPMPPPPANMGHLNFKRMDLESLMKLGDS